MNAATRQVSHVEPVFQVEGSEVSELWEELSL
jgi:hypothetical protein